jgi:hypothetical protein
MYEHPTPNVEPRLKKRYRRLVNEHLHHQESWAAGAKALPLITQQAFAATPK